MAHGRAVLETREPGGTPQAEALRSLLVSGEPGDWSPQAEALLNYAARDSHLRQVVRPALQRGDTVLCDRFMDSTRAYQGYAGGCSMAFIDRLEQEVVASTRPDLTLILDLPPEIGLARARARGTPAEDRFERKGLEFHQRLRDGFQDIARRDVQRCRIIDAGQPLDVVSAKVIQAVEAHFG